MSSIPAPAAKLADPTELPAVSWKGYVALAFAIVFFSGLLKDASGDWAWLRTFDFNVLLGHLGKIGGAGDFRGSGGDGARDGFMFTLTLMPAVILALAAIAVIEAYGALDAARKLLSPLLRPLMGVPGGATLALIGSLQSTDAGGAMTKGLAEEKIITDDERTIFTMWQLSAGATITNFFSSGAALFAFLTVPIIVPLLVMFAFKFFGANLIRIYIRWVNAREGAQS
ncbi:MAG: nucleoside recognition domain-containing protein [Burkholderiaceae bacterium]